MKAQEPSSEIESSAELPDWLSDLDSTPKPRLTEPEAVATSIPEWMQTEPESPELAAKDATWLPKDLEAPVAETPQTAIPQPATMRPSQEAASSGRADGTPLGPTPLRPRPAPAVPIEETPSLGTAKSEMGRGNIAAALSIYGRWIRRGRSLPEIIRELRDALYRYPVEVSIWQALGDAYMRANRLQEALDAYTKAEELLR
jgi:hypothetical protein